MKYFPEYKRDNELNEGLKLKVERFREYLGYPCSITSGYEPGTGHSDKSEHYELDANGNPCSMAVDITSKAPLFWMVLCAERAGFENIGIYPAFNGVHLGVRGSDDRRWIGLGTDSSQKYLPWTVDNVSMALLTKK